MGLRRAAAIVLCVIVMGGPSAQAGEVRGRVRLDGAIPEPATITVTPKKAERDAEGCDRLTRTSQRLVVDSEGGIQHAVVWIQDPTDQGTGTGPVSVVLNQQGCVFDPHVVVVPPGGHLAIRNADPVLHNIRIYQESTRLTNAWQKQDDGEFIWEAEAPGPYLVRCGVHSWMHAWVMVAEHHEYAVTDSAGGFQLPALPEGSYTLRVWHETLGERQQRIDVEGSETMVMVRYSNEGG